MTSVNTQYSNNNNITYASSAKPAAAKNSIYTANGTSSSTSCETTKQTETNALDKALAEVIGKDYPKIKEELNRICEKLGIRIPENKVELTEEKIKEIAEKVQKLVDSLKAKNLEINAENLFKAACYAIDTKILEDCGLTREEYEEAVKNGKAKSLRELLGLKEGEEITEEAVAAFAKKVVAESQARIKNAPDRAQAIKEELAAQKKQFALCLVSTSVEDRAKLFNAIEHAYSENRAEFINDIFASLTPEARVELAKQIGFDKINKMLSTPDANGNTCTIDQKTGAIVTIVKNQNAETIKSNEEDFMAKAEEFFAREDVAAVQAKIKNGEELTETEQKIAERIQTYTAYSAGTQIGVANSMVLSEDARKELLTLIHSDSYKLPNYREVLEQMVSFVENEANAEYLTISKEEFGELMDKASNGNYSTVVSDIQNGTTTELNVPKDPNATSAADLGYTNKESIDTTSLMNLRAQVAEQSEKEDTTFVVEKEEDKKEAPSNRKYSLNAYEKYGEKGIKAYIKTYGIEDFIPEAIKTGSQTAKNIAKQLYKHDDSASQVKQASETMSVKVGTKLLQWMSKTSFNNITQMGTGALTKVLNSMKEEKEEKNGEVVNV